MVMGGEASKISQSMPVKSSFSSWHFMKWDSWWWVTPGPVGSYRNHQAAPPTVAAPTYPPIAMYLKNSHLEIRGSLGERGGLPMMSRSGGLKPRAVAGRPSVTRLTQGSSQEDTDDLTNVGGDEVTDELLHVVVDSSALLNSRHNGREVVVSQDHLRGRLGNGSARAHGDADLGLLQG